MESDLSSEEELDAVQETFQKAVGQVKLLASSGLQSEKLLEAYKYYKQATEGPCRAPRPSWYAVREKAKWEAWSSLGEMDREAAMLRYISVVREFDPAWDPETANPGKETWVTVSCLQPQEPPKTDQEKTIFDFVKDGQIELFCDAFFAEQLTVDRKDEEGMGFIHWAADRGHLDLLKKLVELQADVNLTDGDGQTALHYAASCDYVECARFLLESGADAGKKDAEGMTALQVAGSGCREAFAADGLETLQ